MKGSHLTHFQSFSIMKMGQMTSKVPKHFFVHCQKYRMTPYISWFCTFIFHFFIFFWFCTFIHIISSPLPAQPSSPIIHPGSRNKSGSREVGIVTFLPPTTDFLRVYVNGNFILAVKGMI